MVPAGIPKHMLALRLTQYPRGSSQLFSAHTYPKSLQPLGFPSPNFWFLYKSVIAVMCPLFLSPQFSLLVIFSLLLSLSALDSPRCLWLYSSQQP